MLQSVYQEWLRRLALGDEDAVERVMRGDILDAPLLDEKAASLVRLACVVAVGSEGPALSAAIDDCYAIGIENAEIVEMVESISFVIGSEQARQATSTILTADRLSA